MELKGTQVTSEKMVEMTRFNLLNLQMRKLEAMGRLNDSSKVTDFFSFLGGAYLLDISLFLSLSTFPSPIKLEPDSLAQINSHLPGLLKHWT